MLKESGSRSHEGRWHSAPADRNTAPIAEVLRAVLPDRGDVLEIASGTGQHVVAFARTFPDLVWHPSDCDSELRESVELRMAEASLDNIRPPIELDVMRLPWAVGTVDAVVCINMIHVAPWRATGALFTGAAQVLRAGGPLVTYGPYMRDGRHTAPSNAAFNASLRARDAEWGLRDLSAVTEAAQRRGLALERLVEMPANNFSLVFKTGTV